MFLIYVLFKKHAETFNFEGAALLYFIGRCKGMLMKVSFYYALTHTQVYLYYRCIDKERERLVQGNCMLTFTRFINNYHFFFCNDKYLHSIFMLILCVKSYLKKYRRNIK